MKELKIDQLKDLREFKLSKKLSAFAWDALNAMDDENRQLLGSSFVKSVDEVGAYISEGFNLLENNAKINVYVKSKTSLSKAVDHWTELMLKRNVISKITYGAIKDLEKPLKTKLNSRINEIIKQKK